MSILSFRFFFLVMAMSYNNKLNITSTISNKFDLSQEATQFIEEVERALDEFICLLKDSE
jgi:hypothetical protein